MFLVILYLYIELINMLYILEYWIGIVGCKILDPPLVERPPPLRLELPLAHASAVGV